MEIQVDASQVLAKAGVLARASDRLIGELERVGTERGSDAVRFIQRKFRTGAPYTTETRTARRTGGLYDSYDSEVVPVRGTRRGIDLRIGLIKPGESDDVLRRGRIHEGYDAAGNRVDEFVITPRNSEYLLFQLPPELGGGWRRVKKVVLKARPTFPEVAERLPPYLEQDVKDAYQRVTVQ